MDSKDDVRKKDADKSRIHGQRKLYKSREDKIIDGVFGGIAEYIDVDPTLVRLVGVLLFLAQAGGMIVFYILASIIIPVAPASDKKTEKEPKRIDGNLLFGGILIVLGVVFLFQKFFVWLRWDYVWPAIIILIGIYMITRR